MRHEVYVWQRAWTEPVRNAVEQHGTNFSALAVLKAEVSWKDKKPQVTRVAVDYATLAKTQRPIGIALRIGPYAGPFAAERAGASRTRQASDTPIPTRRSEAALERVRPDRRSDHHVSLRPRRVARGAGPDESTST